MGGAKIQMETSVKVREKQGFFASLAGKTTALATTLTLSAYSITVTAHADEAGALKNAGITAGSLTGEGTASLFSNLKNVVYLIMGIGGLWAVGWIIIGGMLLAGSGSNPQKRTAGMGAIAVAAVGVYVIYKAYTIAGWAIGLGGTS